MTRTDQITEYLALICAGQVGKAEGARILDAHYRVRGAFEGRTFTGYDYQDQRWIEYGR